ncbi:methyltransferase domain-containing protein [Amycolatopsis sp. PS_44_ISF1]|uniref:methyltransferase domain-containing protein n=1 Tax=Amycolatopsis sp. PS_44_ISF1 TaxID=2974917 RepID=UPI0028DDE1C2|nr:methyltransferase domain-containing protein [Amycolatopsis sp. PS_44_ISF1]MDT8910467.1 class I SAM-dependent methyltransferase [Amycolatopsis sp. PS_44_ISF1]
MSTHLADALAAYRAGDRARAANLAGRTDSPLGAELSAYLTTDGAGPVYDQPRAFTAFIRGGGNVELYRRLSAELAARYDRLRPESLLDLGCGDGLAVVPALAQSSFRPSRIDLVEPSSGLLSAVDVPGANRFEATAQEFLASSGSTWNLAQSTFALQSIPSAERAELLRNLCPCTATLVLAEFDVPEQPEGSAEHLHSLAARYERGVAEYGEDASLVAQGFLLPVLLGLVADEQRTNWEQPAADWSAQLAGAGFAEIDVEPLADYWWSPAVLVTARGSHAG